MNYSIVRSAAKDIPRRNPCIVIGGTSAARNRPVNVRSVSSERGEKRPSNDILERCTRRKILRKKRSKYRPTYCSNHDF